MGTGRRFWGREGCVGAAMHSPECRLEKPSISRCLFGFSTALSCTGFVPTMWVNVYSRYLRGFAYTRSCEPACERGFFLSFLERNPPAM